MMQWIKRIMLGAAIALLIPVQSMGDEKRGNVKNTGPVEESPKELIEELEDETRGIARTPIPMEEEEGDIEPQAPHDMDGTRHPDFGHYSNEK